MKALLIFGLIWSFSFGHLAFSQDWSEGANVAVGGRSNPYGLNSVGFERASFEGKKHALNYPVTDTGMLLPYHAIRRFLNGELTNPLKLLITQLLGAVSPFSSFDEMEAWLGLVRYPLNLPEGVEVNEALFVPEAINPGHRMGLSLMEADNGALAFSISCAQCHSGNLFGQSVMGMTNRFPRANDFFQRGLKVLPKVSVESIQWATKASKEETELLRRVVEASPFIGAKKPSQLGLDTSLAQVALSLSKRSLDDFSTKDPKVIPRPEKLQTFVADSKPAVWWNVKYKNRWLSDGSVVSGNPIFTNIIWNELGRGADLIKIEAWLNDNPETVRELTTAVFAAKPPQWSDFFSAESISEIEARSGERIYQAHCSRCHGEHLKNWSLSEYDDLPWKERMKTYRVFYFPKTFVVDVGTDPGRREGMSSLVPLNNLSVSRKNGILIQVQEGYVPPPLDGIWARWPYFHNNSSPSLCAVLTKGKDRPVTYWAREANHKSKDFDSKCNGYPESRFELFLPKDQRFDSRGQGLSRFGHDEGIFLKDGRELMTQEQKFQLIQYLQTL